MDTEEPLGLPVPWLQVGIVDRPGGRDAFDMLHLAEVAFAVAHHDRAEELGRAAGIIPGLRPVRLPAAVVPALVGAVLELEEDLLDAGVVRLTRDCLAAFQQKNVVALLRETPGHRPAACAGADDDHVRGAAERPVDTGGCGIEHLGCPGKVSSRRGRGGARRRLPARACSGKVGQTAPPRRSTSRSRPLAELRAREARRPH